MDFQQNRCLACWNCIHQVFRDELGQMAKQEVKLEVKAGSHPKVCKARPVPFAIRGAIGKRLDQLESDGIVEKSLPVTELHL